MELSGVPSAFGVSPGLVDRLDGDAVETIEGDVARRLRDRD